MILREEILSLTYLKKTEFTGCHQGMRYRLEKVQAGEEERLKVTVWPEPFNFFTTPEEAKEAADFDFSEEGITQAVDWMNEMLLKEPEKWDNSKEKWDNYTLDK